MTEGRMRSQPVVMITGAAGSLGRAVARVFDEAGASLVLVDVSEPALQKAWPQRETHHSLHAVDLTDAGAAQKLADALIAAHGRIDALCNIAGGFTMGSPVHAT